MTTTPHPDRAVHARELSEITRKLKPSKRAARITGNDPQTEPASTETRAMTYAVTQELTVQAALVAARRATFDPGRYTQRVRYDAHEMETLERWQARAVLVALSSAHADALPSSPGSDVTEHEQAELQRLGLTGTDADA
jgi:uncharacterized protein YbaP (TraB family)